MMLAVGGPWGFFSSLLLGHGSGWSSAILLLPWWKRSMAAPLSNKCLYGPCVVPVAALSLPAGRGGEGEGGGRTAGAGSGQGDRLREGPSRWIFHFLNLSMQALVESVPPLADSMYWMFSSGVDHDICSAYGSFNCSIWNSSDTLFVGCSSSIHLLH